MEFSTTLFDEWSAAWHQNKVRKPNGNVVYKCVATNCKKTASSKTANRTCWNHRKWSDVAKCSDTAKTCSEAAAKQPPAGLVL